MIPDTAVKEWSTQSINPRTNEKVEHPGLRHEQSAIMSLKVQIEYNPLVRFYSKEIADISDAPADQVTIETEVIQEWNKLERLLDTFVTDINDIKITRACRREATTLDALTKTRVCFSQNDLVGYKSLLDGLNSASNDLKDSTSDISSLNMGI